MNEFRHQSLRGIWSIIATNRVHKPTTRTEKPEFVATDPFVTGNEKNTPSEIYSIREQPSITASWKTRVFANKFPLLALESPSSHELKGIYSTIGGFGAHEMVIDHQKSNKHLCRFSAENLRDLMLTFRDRIASLCQDERIESIIAFKNQGTFAGNTIPHSHSQIVALPFIAPDIAVQIENSRNHYRDNGRCLLCDTLSFEEAQKDRVLFRNRSFIAFAPFAPRFEFEIWVAPIVHQSSFTNITKDALADLGEILQWSLQRLGIALNNPDLNLLIVTDPPRRNNFDPNYFHQISRFFHWHIEILPRIHPFDGFEIASGVYVCTIAPETYVEYLKELNIFN
ncbi:MAG: DUF4931 domain-containing protein [Helicobacteraceae bacterium]|jgi:UDPglucose--hexose-1-phosphate uridylyltransferase|nr:DUF4931 domain-containing protein [Helicobacteraceae bacterium]